MFLQQRSLLTKFDQTKLLQILITVTMVAGIGAQQIYFELSSTRFEPHPIASLLGRLAPLLVIAPVGYWMMGRMLRRNFMRRRPYTLLWKTFLDNDPEVAAAVERLSSLSSRNVDEFRILLVQHRDCSRVREFENESIRRIQGAVFVEEPALLEAYRDLNNESVRLGDELIRVVRVVGKPRDLARTIDQVRGNIRGKSEPADRGDATTAAAIPVHRVTAAQGAWTVVGAVLTLMLVAGALASYVPGLIAK